ncbi:esterase-like activity of phytase family protein [Oricola nitratireducens]|uniref:esterase-like activity of phytase family protein n=1 Tax=Oricola nitratireducens TaxID=2775868 RepID=UPI0031BB25FA
MQTPAPVIRGIAVAAFGVAALFPAAGAVATPDIIPMTVTSSPITNFRIGTDQQRFGELEFAGGLEMTASSRHFGALSALHVFPDRSRILGVADTGLWFAGHIDRDKTGRPTGLSGASMWRMVPGSIAKWKTDAEGMTVAGGTVFVSFEQRHRIAEYELPKDGHPVLLREQKPPVPIYELRDNKGFETVAVAPNSLPIAGALVGVTERSLDKNGNMMAFVRWPDGSSYEFSVKRSDEFDITDGQFLPDGDLILLERRFNMIDGVAMRIRRIPGKDIAEGATVDGKVLLEANMLYQIDNMEGLSISIDPDGTPRLTLVSDDNHSILQRNLLLEFRLVGDMPEQG